MRRATTLLRAGPVMLLVLLAGATYQGVATARERRAYPRPGRLVSVGDYQLHIRCSGRGTPVVVLEAPAVGMSAAWGWVLPEVAAVTRVCAYDRAGLGWSERGDSPMTPADASNQLSTLLSNAGEPPPFVVVGQGLGAALAMVFAAQSPERTAALVLVDDPVSQSPAAIVERTMRFSRAWPWLARVGVLRAGSILSKWAVGLPQPDAGALGAFLNRPDHLTQAVKELSREGAVVSSAEQAAAPTIPVTRLTTGGTTLFLTNQGAAAKVAGAIVEAVQKTRRPAQPVARGSTHGSGLLT